MSDDTKDLLDTREHTHGTFNQRANIMQAMKAVMRPHYAELSYDQIEALEMIVNKMSRILLGDANFKDHWADISGYARLALDNIKTPDIPDLRELDRQRRNAPYAQERAQDGRNDATGD